MTIYYNIDDIVEPLLDFNKAEDTEDLQNDQSRLENDVVKLEDLIRDLTGYLLDVEIRISEKSRRTKARP